MHRYLLGFVLILALLSSSQAFGSHSYQRGSFQICLKKLGEYVELQCGDRAIADNYDQLLAEACSNSMGLVDLIGLACPQIFP